jgi:LEA14-like dessication related protein
VDNHRELDPSPWSLTNLTCTGGTYTVNGSTATLTVVSGQTITCTFTNNFGYANLQVTKTATPTYDRNYTWTIDKGVDQTTINTTSGGSATFNYTVKATPTPQDSNYRVTGTISVHNPNTVPVPGVSLVDSMTGGTCSITGATAGFTVAAGATATFDYTCTFATKPIGAQTNTATATWTAGQPYGTTGTAPADFAAATVNITGGQTTVVTDDKTDPANPVILGTADALDPSTHSYTYSITKTAPTGSCIDYTNTASVSTGGSDSVTVTLCGSQGLTVSKTAAASFNRDWDWVVTKTLTSDERIIADPTTGDATANYTVTATPTKTDSGWAVKGTITVVNPNGVAVTGLTISDSMTGSPSCALDAAAPTSIAANTSVGLAYTCTYSQAPPTGTLINTVNVTWATSGHVPSGSQSATAATTFDNLAPASETDTSLTLTDVESDWLGGSITADAPGVLTNSYSHTWNVGTAGTCQTFTNTVTAPGLPDAQASVEVCRAADLSVSKTATGSLTRTYLWSINKSLGEIDADVPAGFTVSLPYSVVVTNTGHSDSAFKVTGSITVTNPNTWQPVTLTGVSDVLSDGTTCTILTGDVYATLAANGGSEPYTYECVYPAGASPAYSGTNTATATWSQAAAHTAIGSANGSDGYSLDDSVTPMRDTVTVTDTMSLDGVAGATGTLGTVTLADSPKTFTDTRTVTAPTGSCVVVTNEAKLVETGGTADTTKRICGYAAITSRKSADGAFARAWAWDIAKDATETRIVANPTTGYAVAEYTVTVTPTKTDSGAVVTGTITVSNPNDIALPVTITDTIGDVTCTVTGGSTVPAKGSLTVDYSCTLNSVPTGVVTNTAHITWPTTDYIPAGSADPSATVDFATVNPAVTGDGVTVSDPNSPAGTYGPFYAKGGAQKVTYTHTWQGTAGTCVDKINTATLSTGLSDDATVTVCREAPVTATKTGQLDYDRDWNWTIVKDAADTTLVVDPATGTAKATYTVTVTPTKTEGGAVVTGTITVTNPNDVALPVTIVDSVDSVTCTLTGDSTVPANGTLTVTYRCELGAVPTADVTNTATISWIATDYIAAGSVSPTATIKASDFTAHVTGQTITVSDPEAPGGTLGSFDAEAGAKSSTYNVEWSVTPGTCVDYPNTATIDQTTQSDDATVTVCQAAEVTATKTGAGAFTRTWSWTADKTVTTPLPIYAEPTSGQASVDYQVVVTPSKTDSAAVVTGTITVTNPNRVALTATVGDTMAGATCTLTTLDRTIPAATDAGPGVLTVGYRCALDSVPTGTVTNTADISWAATEYVPAGHLTPTATVDFGQAAITEVNTSTTVSDPVSGWPDNSKTVSDTSKPTTLTYSHTWTVDNAGTCQTFDNTATLTPGTGDSAQVEICRGADLVVTKTAAGSLTRTYAWSIDKTVGAFDGNVPAGTEVSIPYTVSVNGAGHTDSAWQVAGTITVTNPNARQPVTLTGVSDALSDSNATCTVTGDQTATIAPLGRADFTYTCTYAAQPAAYTGTNTATATWSQQAAHTANGSDSGDAAYDLANSVTPVNDTVHMTDTFNGGAAEELGTVSISDTLSKAFPVSRKVIAPQGSCLTVNNTATITETKVSDDAQATVCGGLGLTVTKTATPGYGVTYPWTITKDASRTEILVGEGGDTSVTYTVKATAGAAYPSSWTLTGTITVSNPNDWEAINATVTDTVNIDGVTCTIDGASTVSVPRATGGQPGTAQVTYTCSLAPGTNPGTWDGTNTATATWSADDASTATGSATGTAPVTGSQTGATNAWVTVTDTLGGDTVTLGTVDADGTLHPEAGIGTADGAFTYTKALTGTPGACETIDNTATITQTAQSDDASVQLCIVKGVTASKSGAGTFTRTYPWTVTKDVEDTVIEVKPDGTATFNYTVTAHQGTPVDSAHVLAGTVTVTNPNAFPISATVADGLQGCSYPNGPTVTVADGGSLDVAYTCPVDSKLDTNTATVTWTATTDNGDLEGTTSAIATGIAYTETVSVDDSIEVWDNKTGATAISLGTAAWGDGSTPVKFTYSIDKAGSATAPGSCSTYDNEAWVKTAYNDSKDTEQVKVCVGADLSVTKTATTSYARDYQWKIAKKLANDTLETPAGAPATAAYTVTVSKDGWTDSAWTLTGTITVANPNTWQDVIVDITDSVDIGGGAVCTVVGGAAVSVPRSDSVTVDYSCTFTGQPAYTGTNTATATWNGAQAHTASSSDDGTAGVSYGDPATETHRTITVTDTPAGGDTVTLGTLNYLTAPDSTDYTYSAQFAGVAGTCTDYDNTAEITETSQTASATVTVCVGLDLTVEKTAAGGFTRTYLWSIDKSVVDDSITVPAGTNASMDYRVRVSPDGYADSAQALGGTITVSNPNDWQDISARVTDVVDIAGVTCTITEALPVSVPQSGSVTLHYSCTGDYAGDYAGTNTATANWDAAAANTPTGTANGSAGFTMAQTSVNQSVTVTDTPQGGSTVTLGTADWFTGITPSTGSPRSTRGPSATRRRMPVWPGRARHTTTPRPSPRPTRPTTRGRPCAWARM